MGRGVCANCYGTDMATGAAVEIGGSFGDTTPNPKRGRGRKKRASRNRKFLPKLAATFNSVENLFCLRSTPLLRDLFFLPLDESLHLC